MAPERLNIEVDMLSHPSPAISPLCPARAKTNFKLVRNLMSKKKYVVHYLNLKFYLDNGMRLGKVHRVIRFAEARLMEPFISMNIKMRAQAKNEMEKDFHKLMNNAVYGKSCENQRKRTDLDLFTDMSKAAKLIIKPHLLNVRMFH